jgi:hypothetical protein
MSSYLLPRVGLQARISRHGVVIDSLRNRPHVHGLKSERFQVLHAVKMEACGNVS